MMDALFGDTAHRLFAQAYPPDALRAVERGQAPAAAWEAIEDSGFLDALLPEDVFGGGLTADLDAKIGGVLVQAGDQNGCSDTTISASSGKTSEIRI